MSCHFQSLIARLPFLWSCSWSPHHFTQLLGTGAAMSLATILLSVFSALPHCRPSPCIYSVPMSVSPALSVSICLSINTCFQVKQNHISGLWNSSQSVLHLKFSNTYPNVFIKTISFKLFICLDHSFSVNTCLHSRHFLHSMILNAIVLFASYLPESHPEGPLSL